MTTEEADKAIKNEGAREIAALIGGKGQRCHFLQWPDGRCAGRADGDVDGDGSPHCYHPKDKPGLDALICAGHPGKWWGVVTDNGQETGTPIIQLPTDPAPGFYVAATTYQRKQFRRTNPRAYLDSEVVPFIVIEGYIRRRAKGIVLGCKAKITNTRNGKWIWAVVGDIGPLEKIGELSIAAAIAVGLSGSPRAGGTSDNILLYEFWPDVPGEFGGEKFDLISARKPA